MNIKCLFKGHQLKTARYRGAYPSRTTFNISQNWDDTLNFHKPSIVGFMHHGLIADCQRCGKTIDVDDINLPILQPEFMEGLDEI